MIYPIHTGSSFRAAEIGETVKHSPLFSQNSFVQYRRLTVCSSIAAASHHHKGSRLIYGPLASILLDQGFPVEYGDFHASPRNNQNHKLTGTTIFSVLKQQTQLLLHYGKYIPLTHSTMP